jgi:Holliday junction DNA helicase RuvA
MISRLHGTLLVRDPDGVEVETPGGVVYEVEVPLTVFQRLPAAGEPVRLRTVQVVTETSAALYGFLDDLERRLFKRLLGASGVGGKLALAMLGTYTAQRLARALAEKDVTALRQVTGIGKKTAEKLALELSDKVEDLAVETPGGDVAPTMARDAIQALVALGYSFAEADAAVRGVLDGDEPDSTDELIRRALAAR